MTNADKYLDKRDKYDVMVQIVKGTTNGYPCAIKAVSGEFDINDCRKCNYDCYKCVRIWLDKEVI